MAAQQWRSSIISSFRMANSGLSEEELAEFREIFNLVDADGSGEISREELGELISTLGLKVRNQFHRA